MRAYLIIFVLIVSVGAQAGVQWRISKSGEDTFRTFPSEGVPKTISQDEGLVVELSANSLNSKIILPVKVVNESGLSLIEVSEHLNKINKTESNEIFHIESASDEYADSIVATKIKRIDL